ncbi:hypothetical protein ACHAPT_007576, partial [Fusarium lateritium]
MSVVSSRAGSEELFWPNIKQAIWNEPSGQPQSQRMKPQCPICLENVSIATFRKPTGNPSRCVVLFCGHIICSECFERSRSVQEREMKECPCCRASLRCDKCRKPVQTFLAPEAGASPDSVFDMPPTKGEDPNLKPLCPGCEAGGESLERIDSGDVPSEAETVEPGAAMFNYGAVDALEAQGRPMSQESVISAYGSVASAEYQTPMNNRQEFMGQWTPELQQANPLFTQGGGYHWHGYASYAEQDDDTYGVLSQAETLNSHYGRFDDDTRGVVSRAGTVNSHYGRFDDDTRSSTRRAETRNSRHGRSRRHQQHRDSTHRGYRETTIEYQAPLDPPLDAEGRARRGRLEAVRRIHDRLPEQTIADGFSSLSLGGGGQEEDRDRSGRPRRGRRDDAGSRDNHFPSSTTRYGRDADRDSYYFPGSQHRGEAAPNPFGGPQRGQDPYSPSPGSQHRGERAPNPFGEPQHGRDPYSHFSGSHHRGEAAPPNPFGGRQRGQDTGSRANYFPAHPPPPPHQDRRNRVRAPPMIPNPQGEEEELHQEYFSAEEQERLEAIRAEIGEVYREHRMAEQQIQDRLRRRRRAE